jgi:exonuclease SbcC
MIQTIHLRNFQKHRKLDLDLAHGVNAIVGPSDSGKTSILRALYWLRFNRPLATEVLQSWNTDEPIKVWVVLDDGTKVGRIKSAKENLYFINDTEFKSFGANPPDEILDALGVGEINFHQQMDGLFLLSDTPGEVARKLNEYAELDDIDTVSKRIGQKVRHLEGVVSNAEATIERLETQVEAYSYLEDMRDRVEKVERLEESFRRKARVVSSIQTCLTKIEAAREHLENAKQEEKKISGGEGVVGKWELLRSMEFERDSLAEVLDHMATDEEKLKEAKETRDKLINQFNELMPDTCPLCGSEVAQ